MGEYDMQFFDAHTHVQFSAFDADRGEVLARAATAGVGMVNVGTQATTSAAAIALAEKNENIYAAIGLHPIHTSKSYHDEAELGGGEGAKAFTSRGEIFDAAVYRALALNPKTVAIGECGLDYFHFNEDESREEQIKKQKAAFLAQMALSRDVRKPLMIHCRNAFDDLIAMLAAHRELLNAEPGVIHFFTGTVADARALLDLGFSFTFGGVVTFARSYDEVVKFIPTDRILSETDAPYLAPVPYRGKRDEPAYVVETVKKLAELKSITVDEMAAQILANARRVFHI